MRLSALPIDEVLPQIIAALREHPSAVLRAPTGAGKTTRVPPALLDAGLGGKGQIVVLQPRRLAAVAAAARISQERETPLGGEAGYHVRFDRRGSHQTRILVMTEGLFLRRLQDDPLLEQVGAVVFDEFHERTLDADLALAIARRLQHEVRSDLKLLVMSATLDPSPIAKFLGGCPCIESAGRLHPVEIQYARFDDRSPLPKQVADGVARMISQTSGDILAFLPGVGEIRRTASELTPWATAENVALLELYGDLPLERQQAVLQPGPQRKIVLATNVAETSVTIPGVTGVVDSGWARVLRADPALGLNRLELTRISQASADQRAGRAGRTAPGVCFRLWTEQAHRAMAEHAVPEIARAELSGAALELLCWGETDLIAFPWYESPPPDSLHQALTLLRRLDATDARGVTDLGRQMGRISAEPRIARLLCEGNRIGHIERIALVAAILSERDPFYRSQRAGRNAGAQHTSRCDILDRVTAFEDFERRGERPRDLGEFDPNAARFIARVRDQLLREARQLADEKSPGNVPPPAAVSDPDEAVRRAIFTAYADRVARRRDVTSRRGVMVGGRGVKLHEQSAVRDAPLFVCVNLEESNKLESLARQASAVEREWLPEHDLTTSVDVEYDAARERVIAFRRTRFFDLVVEEAATNIPADYDAASLLAEAAAERIDAHFFLDESGLKYLARVRSLAQWMPELNLPDLGDEPFRQLLPGLCGGCRSIEEVRKAPIAPAVQALLTPPQIQAVGREAPERLSVPSGSAIPLEYEPGKPPVMAVRIQEIFGMRHTPRVAGGRVAVVMHLLAPNMRPQQVTSDLESFWRTAYHEVRKELRRRYPKHSWPDDPTTATPQRRPGRKS